MRTFLGLFFAYYLTEIVFAPQAPPEYRENAKDYFVDIFLRGILARTHVISEPTANSGANSGNVESGVE